MNLNIKGLSVNTYGEKSGIGIVFVHGFPLTHQMWRHQIQYLQEKFFVAAYDIRGFGASETGNGQFTMEKYVDDLFDVIDGLEIKRPVICGLSMGGYIAFAALARDPQKFSGVILADTKPNADDDAGKLKRQMAIKKINEEGVPAFTEDFIKTILSDHHAAEKSEVYREITALAEKQDPIGVKGGLIAMLSRRDNSALLEKLEIPTLLIAGENDALTPPDAMEEMAKIIPEAEFSVVPGAAHLSPFENPAYVSELIEGFIERKILV